MLNAVYEDAEILVVDKPAGLASQPGAGVTVSLVEAVERDFGFRPFLVHRLDRETAGLIVVARDARAAGKWTELIAGKLARKTYLAVVAGQPPSHRGILRDDVSVRGEAKSAETRWKLLGSFGGPEGSTRLFSLLELELGTGRTHQIRLHLAGTGLPIIGDDRHGDFKLNKSLKKEYSVRKLFLCAWRLSLPGARELHASLPEHFTDFLARFPDAPQLDVSGGGEA
jgi:23S rRNA pseudouridine955/2504/2580 synthase